METRVAVLENSKLEEYVIERYTDDVKVGSIYLGKIVNLQPSLQAAFVDIGMEKNAFLHYNDLFDGLKNIFEMQVAIIEHKSNLSRDEKDKQIARLQDAIYLRRNKKITVDNISDFFRPGTELIVQVVKGPIGTKGPRVSVDITIAGRFLVLMPFNNTIGVSSKIDSKQERKRLKDILSELRIPEGIGLICRTIGEGKKEVYFKRDAELLLDAWKSAEDKISRCDGCFEIYREPDLVNRTARDFMTDEISGIMVDDKNAYRIIHSQLKKYGGLKTACKVKEYRGKEPIFEYYKINEQLYQLMGRQVSLPSGGYICIDETEALIAIDVNSGRAGRSKIEQPELILRTNMEAAEEIARQLRLRNVGGLVVIDFIDMKEEKDRDLIYTTMRNLTRHDKSRTKVLPISQMGLMEMTRQREQESLQSFIFDPCPYCKGTGHLKSSESMSVEIQRELHNITKDRKFKNAMLRIFVHPMVLQRLKTEDAPYLEDIERNSTLQLSFRAEDGLHFESFRIVDEITGEQYFPEVNDDEMV
jgi:ribonuclease G